MRFSARHRTGSGLSRRRQCLQGKAPAAVHRRLIISRQTPQQVAQRCADVLWPEDSASQGMGMALLDLGPGTATVRMTVRAEMTNCHGTCHGGYIFAVADTAFAYACNSWNQRAVAAGADIEYLAPAHAGDTLTARGHAVQQGDRRGIYDIQVSNQDGHVIAVFRGRSARIKGQLFDSGETS